MDVSQVIPRSSKRATKKKPVACKVCGKMCVLGSQRQIRTTCSTKCASTAAARDSQKVVDYVMPMCDVERYLDLMDMANSSMTPEWLRKIARSEAAGIKRDL